MTTESASGRIPNPVAKGDTIVIPKGTVIHTTHPSGRVQVSKRAQTITVSHTLDGWVSRERHNAGKVLLPTVTWPGTGGYWRDVQLTKAVLEANGLELPTPPGQDGYISSTPLLVVPSYEDGYTNEWKPES